MRSSARVEAREHVGLVLGLVVRAREQPAAAMFDDPRVVTGRETGGSCALREREQLGEAEAAVARDARVRRLAAGVAAHEGDNGTPELLAQVERDVRDAERVTGCPRRQHRVGRAARALRARPVRVEPEPQRDADRVGARSKQRDGAVDAPAHRNSTRVGERGAERRADGVRERVGRERLASDRCCFQQGQPGERTIELGASAETIRSASTVRRTNAQSPPREESPTSSTMDPR